MSYLKPMGVMAGVGGVISGLIGFFVAGPAAVPGAVKAGIAGGVQVAVIAKAEGALDAAGAKIEAAADKAGDKLSEVAEKALIVAEKVADVWSKIFLIGYAVNIAYGGTTQSLENYREFCPGGMLDSLPCAAAALTSVSFHSFTMATGGCLVREVYRLVVGGK